MAINNEVEILSQASVYNKKNIECSKERNLKVYFSFPEDGVNEDTGILLLISGYGANPNSKVYKKMRNTFADSYNVVTVQCDYFGNEFMQDPKNIELPLITKENLAGTFASEEIEDIYVTGEFDFYKFVRYGSQYNIELYMKENLTEENIENFNDMGLMQAIDNITAVKYIINMLNLDNKNFNARKVIIYGYSHGAYLGYMCNALAPNLFSMMIDNSAWLFPEYLIDNNRAVFNKIGNLTLNFSFEYKARNFLHDMQILNLNFLYSEIKNNCNIIAYHGVDDSLVDRFGKKKFCEAIDNCTYIEIHKNDLDGVKFKSTGHGLSADFLELFYFTMNRHVEQFEKSKTIDVPKQVIIRTDKHEYLINYDTKNGIPNLVIH